MSTDIPYMMAALEEAKQAALRDEVPIGAVLVNHLTGEIVARAGNRTREMHDPTAHAEILAIREACTIFNAQRIPDCNLYITLEPCAMCAAAISFARIKTVFIGALDPKGGGIYHGGKFYDQPTCHWRPDISHLTEMQTECGQILRDFFKSKRGR